MTDYPNVYTTSKPLTPGKTPGQWVASGKVAGMKPKGSIWREAEEAHGFPNYTYLRADYPTTPVVVEPTPDPVDPTPPVVTDPVDPTPPVTPVEPTPDPTPPVVVVPTPEPSKVTVVVSNDEVHLYNDIVAVGFNTHGGMGTTKNAPAGVFTDKDTGFLRVAMYLKPTATEKYNDFILNGRAIEGFSLGYKVNGGTVVKSNQLLTGYTQIPFTKKLGEGSVTYTGQTTDKVGMIQKTTLLNDDAIVRYDVTLVNYSDKVVSDIRYMRVADPDQSEKFASLNTVQEDETGTMIAGMPNGTPYKYFMFTTAPEANATAFGFVNTNPYGVEVNSNLKPSTKAVDVTLNLVLTLGSLDPHGELSFTIFAGVTKDLAATKAKLLGK